MIKNFFNYIFHRFPKNILSEKLLESEREKESLSEREQNFKDEKGKKFRSTCGAKVVLLLHLLSLAEGCNLEKDFHFF